MSLGSGCLRLAPAQSRLGLAPAQSTGTSSVKYAVSGCWLQASAPGRSLMVTIAGFATISRFQCILEENAGMTL